MGRTIKKALIIILMLLVCYANCFAGFYLSPLGFTVNIPSYWKIANSKKLVEDPSSLEVMMKYWKASGFVTEKQIKEMRGLIETGQVEYWIYRDIDSNVNCRRVSGKGIVKHHEFKTYIKELKKLLGSDAEVYNIGLKKIAGLDAFYSEYGGLVYGFKYLQFNIQITPKEYFQFTLTAPDDSFEVLKGEFWRIISTFKPF